MYDLAEAQLHTMKYDKMKTRFLIENQNNKLVLSKSTGRV